MLVMDEEEEDLERKRLLAPSFPLGGGWLIIIPAGAFARALFVVEP